MKRTSKARGKPRREAIIGSAVEKPLLSLHAAMDIGTFWRAVQQVINAAMPGSFMGVTLQHNPILPMITKWSRPIANGVFNSKPLEAYLDAHPRSKFVRTNDVFPQRSKLMKSDFYRQYMAPQKRHYAVGLFFWRGQRLICVIVIMRTQKQGDLTARQMNLLRHLYPQFQTALRRLASLEREHSARMAFEEFLSRLPLPTILVRWNLKLVYQNHAAREFCALWERGPEMARLLKANASLPSEILDGCRVLKKQWHESPHLSIPTPSFRRAIVHHPTRPHLRATVSLKPLGSAGVARPHFLIECEELRRRAAPEQARARARLPHLARLTAREQQVTWLVCDGRSNQEIADAAALSLAMVKKHLHAIFGKLEVTSRSRLIALMR
jgi:DNA-binding CsgD family transcriptional regulator